MSCKSMETDVLVRCSMDWKQVEIGLSTDLLPPGWASYEENLSRNIYAFLKFTLALARFFYFRFIVQGNEYRKETSKFNNLGNFVIIQSLNLMRGSVASSWPKR